MAKEGIYRIVLHWTAGGSTANPTDKFHYHFIVEQNGHVEYGKFPVSANSKNRRLIWGTYAAHTKLGNSGAIGVSMCGMMNYSYGNPYGYDKKRHSPLTKIQCEACFKLIAGLCHEYDIPIDKTHVYTHREHDLINRINQGKQDILYLPPYNMLERNKWAYPSSIGNYIRQRVKEYYGMLYGSSPNTSTKDNSTTSGQNEAITSEEDTSIEVTGREIYGGSAEDVSGIITGAAAPVTFKDLFKVQKDTSGKPLAWLRTTNNWLETFPSIVTIAFGNMIGTGENITQEKVDSICELLAYKTNVAIERQRQRLIRILYAQYTSNTRGPVWQAAFAIQAFFADPVGAVGKFASSIWKPVKVVFDWVKALVKEVPRLAENLARIASTLPPTPPTPNINFDKFKLKVNSIGMKEIAKGPAGFKDPEDMFPKPSDPYKQDDFILFGDDVSEFLDDGLQRKKYNLKPDDFESMSSAIAKQSKSSLLDFNLTLDSFESVSKIDEINRAFSEGATQNTENSELEKP